jgi:curved DNA-binding protein CbpA
MRWKNLNKGYADRIVAMAAMTPYELLGVASNAAQAEVRVAYLKLIKAYHPDKADPFMARHNEEIVKLVNAAYEKMKDRS